MSRPLEGIRIIDLTHVWAGPLATRILADLGAEVIKVEARAGRGLAAVPKGAPGFWQGEPGDEPYNRQALFNKLNRNKESVCLDLKHEGGRQILLDMIASSHAIIENFSARAMRSLRLDFPELIKVNPTIVYVAMPGYGTYGPISDYVAFGPSVELMTGLTTLLGYGQNEPRTTSIALPDAISGVTAAAGLVSALLRKKREGTGGFVDLALHESAINMLGEFLVREQLTGETAGVLGNRDLVHAPQGLYPCLPTEGNNGYVFIGCRTEQEWTSLVAVIDNKRLRDSRFDTEAGRRGGHDEIDAVIAEFTESKDKLALMSQLQSAGVPAGAVMVAPEFMADPHVTARDYFVSLGGDGLPHLPFPGSPILIDGVRHKGFHRAPRLGEHNREVLEGLLGYSNQKINDLVTAGVLADRPPE